MDAAKEHRHGCHNRKPIRSDIVVQQGWEYEWKGFNSLTRKPLLATMPDPMTKDCQYSKSSPNDPSCADCKWKAKE